MEHEGGALTMIPKESGEQRWCNRLTRFASVLKVTPNVFSLKVHAKIIVIIE